MARRGIWLMFVLLTLAACAPQPEPLPDPLPTAEAEMVAEPSPLYFPAVIMSAPLVADQRTGPEVCMAWSGLFLNEARRDFDNQLYYHTSTWAAPSSTAVPIVRSRPGLREDVAKQLLYLKSIGWRGLVILANEPDMADQDAITRPQDMAGLYWYATQVLPDATFITPNAISVPYLDEFLDYANLRSKDRVGIHIYQGTAATAVHTWPGAWMRIVEGVLSKHGVKNTLWISEVGIPESWNLATSTRYAQELFASRAEVVCMYTTNCGGWLPGCGWDLYTPTGTKTTSGLALQSVIAGPPQEAYP